MYLCMLLYPVIFNFAMLFFKKYGRMHRFFGLLLLIQLFIGVIVFIYENKKKVSLNNIYPNIYFKYDITLGIMGIIVAQSAVYDFSLGHNVKNRASGVLDQDTVVTTSEMQEHVYYQVLNLVQICYLHFIDSNWSFFNRSFALFAVTAVWLVRSHFPVNKFSDNYTKGQSSFSLISIMYRTKKYQYVFYKHFLLHGLNAYQAFRNDERGKIVLQSYFRIYWLCLNMSYVFEFFLQSLVRGRFLKQSKMLIMQQILMIASTLAAIIVVLNDVNFAIAIFSLILNFINRSMGDTVNLFIAVSVWMIVFMDS